MPPGLSTRDVWKTNRMKNISMLVVLGLATILGLYAGKLMRLFRLPSIVGYMLLGVILGVSAFGVIDISDLEHMTFITEMALGFVAFTIGTELSLSSLKKHGYGIIVVIFAESLGAFAVVLILVYLVTGDIALSLVFAAMAPASAPAGTVAVIQECKARGSLTKTLYAVVGFDDGLAIVIFGFADAIARGILEHEGTGNSGSIFPMLYTPVEEIFLSIVIGLAIGLLFCLLAHRMRNSSEIFIISFGAILCATGISTTLNLSLILTNMMVGFVMVNTRREEFVNKVMAPIMQFMPLLFILFFCLAGAHLELGALPGLGMIGAVYILGRSAGLMGGARIGATLGKLEDKIKKYLGLGILSQAGVAIGLALIVKQQFDQIGTAHALKIGAVVLTTITATCIVFEIVGPILTKIALQKAGEVEEEKSP